MNNVNERSHDNSQSILCIYDTKHNKVQELQRFNRIIESPNWLWDEEVLLFNSEGRLYRYDIGQSMETLIDTGPYNNCNSDHVLLHDQKYIAFSHAPKGTRQSNIYTVPMEGGAPILVTPNAPSFLHGWSYDKQELAYCAFREHMGIISVDIYTLSTSGIEDEKRLTLGEGFNDGPVYSPDNQYIWFNSTRSGLMQIWRMDRDGANTMQMTHNDHNNWFPHISPDGKHVVYLAYREGETDPTEHPPNMNVELWIINVQSREEHRLISFVGGQGSINVNSWANDSYRFAFIRYNHPLVN